MTATEFHTSKLKAMETVTSDIMLSALLVAGLAYGAPNALQLKHHTEPLQPAVRKNYSDSTHQSVVMREKTALVGMHPQVVTDRGRRMLELRKRAVNSGMRLLTTDELLSDIHVQRGEQA